MTVIITRAVLLSHRLAKTEALELYPLGLSKNRPAVNM